MTDTLRCAIVGTGAIAHSHIRAISAYTHAGGTYITSGCAAGLQLGAAAILTGEDRAKKAGPAIPRRSTRIVGVFFTLPEPSRHTPL